MNKASAALRRVLSMLCGVLAATPLMVHAGANNARLRCVSTASKQEPVTITGNVPGNFASFELTVAAPGGSLAMDDARWTIEVIEDFRHGVFSLVVGGPEPGMVLYALPGTVKHKAGAGFVHATFAGVLVRAPSPGPASPTRPALINVPVSCSYHYEI